MNPSGLPCSSPSPVLGPPAAGVGAAGLAGGGGAGAGGGGGGGGAVKLKFCRYYAKDKTCFYGEECQFLHEEPGAAPAGPGPAAPLGALPLGLPRGGGGAGESRAGGGRRRRRRRRRRRGAGWPAAGDSWNGWRWVS